MSYESARIVKGIPEEDVVAVVQGIPIHDMEQDDDPMVVKGVALFRDSPDTFPEDRECKDCPWAILFLLTVAGVIAMAVVWGTEAYEFITDPAHLTTTPAPNVTYGQPMLYNNVTTDEATQAEYDFTVAAEALAAALPFILIAGAGAPVVCAGLFLILANHCAACVVYTSLFACPVIYLTLGLVLMAFNPIAGLIFIALGLLFLCCIFCCWKRMIPFTIELIDACAEVIAEHPCMIPLSMVASVAAISWSLLCQFAFLALYVVQRDTIEKIAQSEAGSKTMLFVLFLIYYWGGMVIMNCNHVTICGVFGRWFFGHDECSLGASLKVAWTTSFGSVCLGSLIVAAIRALEQVAKQMGEEADNPAAQIAFCILRCVIACIGDIMEWFNQFAYVQCAVRGFSFCEAASATYALCTYRNVKYIVAEQLTGFVTLFGTLLCAAAGGISGALCGYLNHADTVPQDIRIICAVCGGIIGFLFGLFVGGAAMGTLESGVTTILVCWAEDPNSEELYNAHPDLVEKFKETTEEGARKEKEEGEHSS